MKRLGVLTILVAVIVGLASAALLGCKPDSDYEIRPAPIHEVRVSLAKSKPPQIVVYIKGGLSDGCTTFNELKTSRDEATVTITVTTKRPKNAACTEVYGFFEQTVNLGSDFVGGQTYTLKVNDYVTPFQYPI